MAIEGVNPKTDEGSDKKTVKGRKKYEKPLINTLNPEKNEIYDYIKNLSKIEDLLNSLKKVEKEDNEETIKIKERENNNIFEKISYILFSLHKNGFKHIFGKDTFLNVYEKYVVYKPKSVSFPTLILNYLDVFSGLDQKVVNVILGKKPEENNSTEENNINYKNPNWAIHILLNIDSFVKKSNENKIDIDEVLNIVFNNFAFQQDLKELLKDFVNGDKTLNVGRLFGILRHDKQLNDGKYYFIIKLIRAGCTDDINKYLKDLGISSKKLAELETIVEKINNLRSSFKGFLTQLKDSGRKYKSLKKEIDDKVEYFNSRTGMKIDWNEYFSQESEKEDINKFYEKFINITKDYFSIFRIRKNEIYNINENYDNIATKKLWSKDQELLRLKNIRNEFMNYNFKDIFNCKYNDKNKTFQYIGYYLKDKEGEESEESKKSKKQSINIENIDFSNPNCMAVNIFNLDERISEALKIL